MNKHLAVVTAAALFASVSAASINAVHADTPSTDPADSPMAAGHATGMVLQIDPTGAVISVDGVDYMLADDVSAEGFEIGDEVTVTYEEGDIPGELIATEIRSARADTGDAAIGTSPADTAAGEVDEGVATAGQTTGLLQQVDPLGGIIVVDGVSYLLDDSIDPADLPASGLVTVSFEESSLGTELVATEVEPAAQ